MADIHSTLDHIAVVAATLEQGVAYCERKLGVSMQKGGEHLRMGTHNFLLKLGDKTYLEVIAINPVAPRPPIPRWFGLDNEEQKSRAARQPFIATFVARTTNITAAAEALPALGAVHALSRDSLKWQITIPDDGELSEHGTVPSLIQWQDGVHPAYALPDSGCRLVQLEVRHPAPDMLARTWRRIGLEEDDLLVIRPAGKGEPAGITAHIATPDGTRTLG